MNTQEVLDSIYLIPVLLEHMEAPTDATTTILRQKHINPEEFRGIKHLLEYHLKFIQGNGENYPLLRKGLGEYFEEYLYDVFRRIGHIMKKEIMLDYGSGNGYYSDQFLKDNPQSVVIAVDKDHSNATKKTNKHNYAIDFEREPDWYEKYQLYFDTVFISELLHCKDKFGMLYIIKSAITMLKRGGKLIVNENEDYCMQWRIGKIKGNERPVVNPVVMQHLTHRLPLKLIKIETINRHNIYVYEKI